MKTSDFDYNLPEERIAYRPAAERQNSKLMVLDREKGEITHRKFFELPGLLKPGDLLVLNNTRVIPARLFGRKKSGERAEILLVEKQDSRTWKCLVRNPKEGLVIEFEDGPSGRLFSGEAGVWLVEFSGDADSYIDDSGSMPLPHYIKREPDAEDRVSYQTVYAEKPGAIAAPTAGLHFTPGLLKEIEHGGVRMTHVTLHVGIGTFKPVKTELVREHDMHPEFREIPPATADAVNAAKSRGGRVIAVGTTVMRTLESSVNEAGEVVPCKGETGLFILPGYGFRGADALITNFHLPRSTLLMLVSAFAGREFIFRAYNEALNRDYRFLSYGDAMFIK
ncbi:MAG: tRNA preQ1(34) S-adenosylmethionine ribosyltransferase-isomerase QueA [Candidatus Dadabacteria bacterium RIFCSPHIGHO2_12_FULL_53_21]|nr:MAG: tRNA preQ1(34) S-adenosylmethionine ribosyltransferase-isomerase QueA [Candidatus Dadabacteria bacterium RIFCSPHIGHO2_12_FULL_53_21]